MRISDWSSDVCSSDLDLADPLPEEIGVDLGGGGPQPHLVGPADRRQRAARGDHRLRRDAVAEVRRAADDVALDDGHLGAQPGGVGGRGVPCWSATDDHEPSSHGAQATGSHPPTLYRSEEHTSELQSLMRIPYAVFCLKKK